MNIKELLLEIVPIPTTTHKTKAMSQWIVEYIHAIQAGYPDDNIVLTNDSYGNLYVTKGKSELYPTMVCHIDTVHSLNNNVEAFVHNDTIYAMDTKEMEQFGTGGDDKVGITITLKMLHHFQNFKAVFFLDEEHGCLGSNQCNADFFDNSTIVLQCDRRGSDDFVNKISGTKLYGKSLRKKILPYLKSYNRKETSGGITDVGAIAKKNTVMVANMSCGYYNPHSSSETINIPDVISTAEMCIDIFNSTINKRYAFNNLSDRNTMPTYHNHYSSYGGYNRYGSYNNYRTFGASTEKKSTSHSYDLEEELSNFEDDENIPNYYEDVDEAIAVIDKPCNICGSHHVEYDEYSLEVWCHNCGEYIYDYNEIYPIKNISNENESTQNQHNQTAFDFKS